jgi:hypothetical protein
MSAIEQTLNFEEIPLTPTQIQINQAQEICEQLQTNALANEEIPVPSPASSPEVELKPRKLSRKKKAALKRKEFEGLKVPELRAQLIELRPEFKGIFNRLPHEYLITCLVYERIAEKKRKEKAATKKPKPVEALKVPKVELKKRKSSKKVKK